MKEIQITYYGDMQFRQVKFIWNPEILIEGYAIVLNYVLLGTATILQKTLTPEMFARDNKIILKKILSNPIQH